MLTLFYSQPATFRQCKFGFFGLTGGYLCWRLMSWAIDYQAFKVLSQEARLTNCADEVSLS
jgi:hypothetical protein